MSYFGIAAPAEPPAPLIEALNKETNVVLRSEEMKSFVDRLGCTLIGGTPKGMADRLGTEATI